MAKKQNQLTNTEEILNMVNLIAEKTGCGLPPAEVNEHKKILAVIPEKMDLLLENQRVMLIKSDNIATRLQKVEIDSMYTKKKIEYIAKNNNELCTKVAICEINIEKIFTSRKTFFWTFSIVWVVLTVIIDWLIRFFSGVK